MNDQPQLKYKPGLELARELPVSLPAGDWVTIIGWFASHDTDGINFLIIPMIIDQLFPLLYDMPSLKAAEAFKSDWQEQRVNGLGNIVKQMMEEMDGPFLVICDTCGARDEYLKLPMGDLTCGCNGPRHIVTEV